MKIYIRKIDNQCVEKQISVLKNIVDDFFGPNLKITLDENVPGGKIIQFIGIDIETRKESLIRILPQTDPRFSSQDIKNLISKTFEINDLLVFYEKSGKYEIEIIKPFESKYEGIYELCKRDERHSLIFLDDVDLFKNRREEFRNWLINKEEYKDNTIRNYVRYISNIYDKGFSSIDLYSVENTEEISNVLKKFKSDASYIQYNQDNNRTPYYALIQYKMFLDNKFNKDLSTYYTENLFNNFWVEKSIAERNKFVTEYPISRIMTMTKEEYCLGHENSQDSFSNILEKGEYAHTGFGIGGANASKFGIYLKKDGKYHGKNDVEIENVEEYWNEFKTQLCSFLTEMSSNEPNFEIDKKYPLLGGPGGYMYLTKLLSLYYPDKYISMSKKDVYKKLGDYFKCDIYENAVVNSFYLNKVFREKIPQSNENDGYYISNAVWKYFDKEDTDVDEIFEPVTGAFNKIYYGVPGSGKSHTVDVIFNKEEYKIQRTTFHPEYTNSDFVGQIIPTVVDGKVEYTFHPGAFTKALEYSLNHIDEKVCLIIEEINRGNSSAIFGDIFQLLDRTKDGNSRYGIYNGPIMDYLDKQGIKVTEIAIPANMWIVATMNTSDQNVFTLDTAFKRRWKMEYIKNIFADDEKSQELKNKVIPLNERYSNITWNTFVTKINKHIIEDPSGINAEDKQLGMYFVSIEEIDNKKEFAEKILSYLWEDVAKINTSYWFGKISSYDELLDNYDKNYLDVFNNIFDDEITVIEDQIIKTVGE